MEGVHGFSTILQGNKILVETEKPSELVTHVITQIVENVDMIGEPRKGVFGTVESWRFSYLAGEEFCFIVAFNEQIQLRICMAFLEYIRKDFFAQFVTGKEKLNRKKYKQFLQKEMEIFVTSKDIDKLRAVQFEVEEVKQLMVQNLKKSESKRRKIRKYHRTNQIVK